MTALQQIFMQIGLQVFIAFVLIATISVFSKTHRKYLVVAYFIFLIATISSYFVPRIAFFESYKMNWQGQLFVVLLSLGFVFGTKILTPKQAGFTFKIRKSVWLPLIVFSTIGVAFNIYVRGFEGISTTGEYVLYQLTMPGLAEEMAFRGVLLGLLNLVFLSRRKILGAELGWGGVILSLAFGLGHSVYFDANRQLQFAQDAFLVTTILSAIMTYLKEKGESIIPSVIFHNIYNASLPLIKLFI